MLGCWNMVLNEEHCVARNLLIFCKNSAVHYSFFIFTVQKFFYTVSQYCAALYDVCSVYCTSERIERFIEAELSCGCMIWLHARPLPRQQIVSFSSFFLCVAGPAYWRESGGRGWEPNTTARKLFISFNPFWLDLKKGIVSRHEYFFDRL